MTVIAGPPTLTVWMSSRGPITSTSPSPGRPHKMPLLDVEARPRQDAVMDDVRAHPAAGRAGERVFGDAGLRRIVARVRVRVRANAAQAKQVRGKELAALGKFFQRVRVSVDAPEHVERLDQHHQLRRAGADHLRRIARIEVIGRKAKHGGDLAMLERAPERGFLLRHHHARHVTFAAYNLHRQHADVQFHHECRLCHLSMARGLLRPTHALWKSSGDLPVEFR